MAAKRKPLNPPWVDPIKKAHDFVTCRVEGCKNRSAHWLSAHAAKGVKRIPVCTPCFRAFPKELHST